VNSSAVDPSEKTGTKSDQTRQRILDAAAAILARDGYRRAKMSDIAAHSKTHPGGIYYYFSSREDLIEQVVLSASGLFIEAVHAALDAHAADAAPLERLSVAMRAGLDIILSDDSYTQAYQRVYKELPESVRARMKPLVDAYQAVWRQLIEDAQNAGAIRADLDPGTVRMLILGAITWSREWFRPERGSIEQIARHAVAIFLDGLSPRQGR
jgi:AcrR family transcriptional regulator